MSDRIEIITKDDYGKRIHPPRLMRDGKLVRPKPTKNGWVWPNE